MRFDNRVAEGKDEWLTPPELLTALGGADSFDLDPCAPIVAPWPTARKCYNIHDNGLFRVWLGRVWLNPPYGNETTRWIARLREHGDGIALIFARTDTETFHDYIWARDRGADAVLFLRGRLTFYHVTGKPAANTSGAPSCLIAWGSYNVKILENCGLDGFLARGRMTTPGLAL